MSKPRDTRSGRVTPGGNRSRKNTSNGCEEAIDDIAGKLRASEKAFVAVIYAALFPESTVIQIAGKCKVDRTTLGRSDNFKRARQGNKRAVCRGYRKADGEIEAIDDTGS